LRILKKSYLYSRSGRAQSPPLLFLWSAELPLPPLREERKRKGGFE